LAAIRLGDWEWARAELEALLTADLERADLAIVHQTLVTLRAYAGEDTAEMMGSLEAMLADDTDPQNRADLRRSKAAVALVAGDLDRAYDSSMEAAAFSWVNGPAPLAYAARAATWARDATRLGDALDRHVASAQHGPALELERIAMRAGLAGLRGRRSEGVALYREALRGWRDLGCRFDLALTALDAATVVGRGDVELDAAFAEARDVLSGLGAVPFLRRLDAALEEPGAADGSGSVTRGRADRAPADGASDELASPTRA
jgi:hypothetical protein